MNNLKLLIEALDYAFSNCIGTETPEKIAKILIKKNVIALPCKIGDTVYKINYNHCCTCPELDYYSIYECKFTLGMYEEIGETVFLTYEDAASAIANKK